MMRGAGTENAGNAVISRIADEIENRILLRFRFTLPFNLLGIGVVFVSRPEVGLRERARVEVEGAADIFMTFPAILDPMTQSTPRTSQDVPARTLDAFRDALIAFDTDLQITELNVAAETLFQVPRDRAMDRLLIEVVRDHRLDRLALEGGEAELDWSGRFLRVRGISGDGAGLLIIEDLTETRTRERELREVMAILSHEFRTPVTAIKGLLEALQSDPPAETQERFLELSLNEVERLVRLSDDLTVGFRPQAQRSFPLSDAISRVLRLIEDELEKRHVTVMVEDAGLVVHCDPDKLVQVLLNLLENALRHGPNPGEVHLTATLEDRFVRVTVDDAGFELPTYDHIFQAHRRGPNSNGSGMGLYVIRSIVTAWQGETWGRYSGIGNEFGFTVPATNTR
jgi:signal transduction histidine kinase